MSPARPRRGIDGRLPGLPAWRGRGWMMQIEPTGQACGAVVTGVDLAGPLAAETVAAIRAAWLQHHVLAFPDQRLSDDDLERFTLAMGGFGEDPFIAPIAGREHIVALARPAEDPAPIRTGI